MKRLLLLLSVLLCSWGLAHAVITLRQDKGSALTHNELDANFTTLQTWAFAVPGQGAFTIDPDGLCDTNILRIPAAGGAAYATLACTDSSADIVYVTLVRAPPEWTTGTITVVGHAVHIGASPAGEAMSFSVDAQCRAGAIALDNTWGTAQTLTIPFTTQNQKVVAATSTITPHGTCTGGTNTSPVLVNVRLTVNTGAFVCATPAECNLISLDILFARP